MGNHRNLEEGRFIGPRPEAQDPTARHWRPHALSLTSTPFLEGEADVCSC